MKVNTGDGEFWSGKKPHPSSGAWCVILVHMAYPAVGIYYDRKPHGILDQVRLIVL